VVTGVVYDDAGRPLDLEPRRVALRLDDAEHEQARKAGLKYHETLPLLPGTYEVRLAALDEGAGRLGTASRWIEVPDLERGTLTLSGLFLFRPAAEAPGARSASPLRDVQALPRFARGGNLFYQLQVLNPQRDTAGETHLTIQARVLERGELRASSAETPLALEQMGPVPQAYTGRIGLQPLRPGDYELQVAVTDHLVRTTALRRVGFTVEP
jgi:hypothetical protein